MKPKPLWLRYLLSVSLLLGGCGFHLRGTVPIPADNLHDIALITAGSADGTSVNALRNLLQRYNIRIREDATWRVLLSDFSHRDYQTAIREIKGNIRDVTLIDGYRVTLFRGDQEINTVTIQNRSNVQYSGSQYIGSTEEASLAHEQIAQDNATSTFRFIQTMINTHNASSSP